MCAVSLELRLAADPPYDGESVLRWLGARLVPGVEELAPDGAYRRTLRLPGGPGIVALAPDGDGVRASLRLADPADEFVADFVGADRGLKRLGLRTLAEVELSNGAPSSNGHRPEARSDMTLRDALSLMLTEGATELVVRDPDGDVRGYLTLDALSRMLGEGRDEALR